jgi:hypothetical protein
MVSQRIEMKVDALKRRKVDKHPLYKEVYLFAFMGLTSKAEKINV